MSSGTVLERTLEIWPAQSTPIFRRIQDPTPVSSSGSSEEAAAVAVVIAVAPTALVVVVVVSRLGTGILILCCRFAALHVPPAGFGTYI